MCNESENAIKKNSGSGRKKGVAVHNNRTALDEQVLAKIESSMKVSVDIIREIRETNKSIAICCEEHGVDWVRFRAMLLRFSFLIDKDFVGKEENYGESVHDAVSECLDRSALCGIERFYMDVLRLKNVDDLLKILPNDFISCFEEAIKLLKERYAEVMNLYYVEGWTYSEIGDALGVTRSRVGQLVDIALRRMARKDALNILLHGKTYRDVYQEEYDKMKEEIQEEIKVERERIASAMKNNLQKPCRSTSYFVGEDDSVKLLELSNRSSNCLNRAHIYTITSLLQHNEDDMLSIRGMGKTCLSEIRDKLLVHGYTPSF